MSEEKNEKTGLLRGFGLRTKLKHALGFHGQAAPELDLSDERCVQHPDLESSLEAEYKLRKALEWLSPRIRRRFAYKQAALLFIKFAMKVVPVIGLYFGAKLLVDAGWFKSFVEWILSILRVLEVDAETGVSNAADLFDTAMHWLLAIVTTLNVIFVVAFRKYNNANFAQIQAARRLLRSMSHQIRGRAFQNLAHSTLTNMAKELDELIHATKKLLKVEDYTFAEFRNLLHMDLNDQQKREALAIIPPIKYHQRIKGLLRHYMRKAARASWCDSASFYTLITLAGIQEMLVMLNHDVYVVFFAAAEAGFATFIAVMQYSTAAESHKNTYDQLETLESQWDKMMRVAAVKGNKVSKRKVLGLITKSEEVFRRSIRSWIDRVQDLVDSRMAAMDEEAEALQNERTSRDSFGEEPAEMMGNPLEDTLEDLDEEQTDNDGTGNEDPGDEGEASNPAPVLSWETDDEDTDDDPDNRG